MGKAERQKCRYHCSSCGKHFRSERAFEWHRTGPAFARQCNDPAADPKGRFIRHDGGVCDLARPYDEDATLWAVR